MQRLQRLGQHSSRGLRRCVYPEQGGECYRQIDRLGVCPVGSGLEGEAIEGERHMGIVRERRLVIGTLRDSDLERVRHSDHIPSAFRRVAMGVTPPDFGSRSFSARQLRLGKVSGQSRLLHGFARVGLCVGFLFPGRSSSEGVFTEPGNRVIEIDQVVGFFRVFS